MYVYALYIQSHDLGDFRALCMHWQSSLWPEAIKHLYEAVRLAEVIALPGELYLKQDEIEQAILGIRASSGHCAEAGRDARRT
jgi:hypothetical protein